MINRKKRDKKSKKINLKSIDQFSKISSILHKKKSFIQLQSISQRFKLSSSKKFENANSKIENSIAKKKSFKRFTRASADVRIIDFIVVDIVFNASKKKSTTIKNVIVNESFDDVIEKSRQLSRNLIDFFNEDFDENESHFENSSFFYFFLFSIMNNKTFFKI